MPTVATGNQAQIACWITYTHPYSQDNKKQDGCAYIQRCGCSQSDHFLAKKDVIFAEEAAGGAPGFGLRGEV